MMRRSLLAGTLLATSVLAWHAPRSVPRIDLRLDREDRNVHARVELDVREPGTVHLLFRGEWDGYPGLEARLLSLEAWSPHGRLPIDTLRPEDLASMKDRASGHRQIRVERPAPITVEYSVTLSRPPQSRYYHRVSQLARAGGHLLGSDILPRIWVQAPHAGGQAAQIGFDALPAGWRVVSVADRTGGVYHVEDAQSAVFIVGALRTRTLHIGPRELTTVIFGEWAIADQRMADAIERMASALHLMAGRAWPSGSYLYATGRVPDDIPGSSAGGQVIDRSAIVYLGGDGNHTVEWERWLNTTSHELIHWYVPTAFRFDNRPPAWFAEGFTDYLALKALLAGELITPETLFEEIGTRLRRYRASPLYGVRSIGEAQADFWEDSAYRYIYDGGAAAAFLLDLAFQSRGRSLEGALRDAHTDATTVRDLTHALGAIPENAWIDPWIAGAAEPDWTAELERYGLAWRGALLEDRDGWATRALGNLRP